MEKKDIKIVLLIFFVALILRIGFILTLDNSIDVWGDWWDELGWKLATGQGYWVNNPFNPEGQIFYAWRPPLFPLLLAGIYSTFGHSYLSAKIFLAILSSISCLLLFFVSRITFSSSKYAIISAFVYTFYPPAIFWTGYLAPVTCEIFLVLLVVLLLLIAERKRELLLFALSGLVVGLGVLTRSLFIIFIPVVFLWLICLHGIKFSFFTTALFALFCFLTVSPWIIRNYYIYGRFVLSSTEGGIVCYIANNPNSIKENSGCWNPTGKDLNLMAEISRMNELEVQKYFYKLAFEFIKENPLIYTKLVIDRFFRFWKITPHTFSGPGENYKNYHVIIAFLTNLPIFILALTGFLFSLKIWRNFVLYYLIILMWSLPIILFFKTVIRYREPLMPFMIILAINGLKNLRKGKNVQ